MQIYRLKGQEEDTIENVGTDTKHAWAIAGVISQEGQSWMRDNIRNDRANDVGSSQLL